MATRDYTVAGAEITPRPRTLTLAEAGKRSIPSTPEYVLDSYIVRETGVSCVIAVEGAEVLGLQVLSRAWPGNPCSNSREEDSLTCCKGVPWQEV